MIECFPNTSEALGSVSSVEERKGKKEKRDPTCEHSLILEMMTPLNELQLAVVIEH